MSVNKPGLIGITGGIGSGKSTVCKIFEVLGIPVYPSDHRAKSLVVEDPILKSSIMELFGQESYTGEVYNRKYIASKVFSDAEALKKLNDLIHPRVAHDFDKWVNENSQKPYVLKEAALIFETKGHLKLDKVINVTALEATRIQRVLKRDSHRTKEDIQKIIKNQLPESTKRSMADFIVENDDDSLLIPQVMELHQTLLNEFGFS